MGNNNNMTDHDVDVEKLNFGFSNIHMPNLNIL